MSDKDDCISRQMAIDEVCKMMRECFGADEEELDAIEVTLNELPAVQPERKRGEWIPVTYRYVPVKDGSLNTKIVWMEATEPDDIEGMKCSVCGTVFDFSEARNWCSECGADMRGIKEHE